MPMAVISGASRGALRSGLYAIRSTVTLMRPQPSMATASETRIAGEQPDRRCLGEPELVDKDGSHHRPEHEHVAVREVDQLQDAVDERVSERDQGMESAVRQPYQENAEELIGA